MRLVQNERGFTLMELVIVLVILGIMAAVAMVNYTDFTVQARNAALQGAFGSHASQLAIATALCRGLPVQATGAEGGCNPATADFSGNFENTVYNLVRISGVEMARGTYTSATGVFKICSGALASGQFITVTYDPAAVAPAPQLAITAGPAPWVAGATCTAAA